MSEALETGEVIDDDRAGTELVRQAQEIVEAPHQRPDYRLAMEMGRAMAASGYFTDAKAEAQAAVKIIIGLDLGISPTAAMTAIHIVQGKPMVGYQILAAKIIQHPHYGYTVDEHTDEVCRVTFTRDGEEIGDVAWDIERAKAIGLVKTGGNWQHYPRNMLFARCLSDGVKWYMPDLITGAAVYVDDEIPGDRRAINPPSDKAPALTDAKAEAQRKEAREAYGQLREVNPTLLPPGAFNKLVRDAEHSHERLAGVVEQIVDLRDREAEIAEVAAALREADAEKADTAEKQIERVMDRREALRILRDALEGSE